MDRAPELLTMEQVAGRMHKTRRWLQDFVRAYPYYRMAGRTKLFTEQDVARLIDKLELPKCHSGLSRPGRGTQTGRSEAHTSEDGLIALQEALRSESPGLSSKPKRLKS